MILTLAQAQAIVECFGGDDETELAVEEWAEAHSGPGIYVHSPDYPDEGSVFIGQGFVGQEEG